MPFSGIVLDVNETLFSLEPLERRFRAVGLDARHVELWFARVLRDGFALAATDSAEAFPLIGRHHLAQLLTEDGLPPTEGDVAYVLAGFDEVTPHPDVPEGLHAAHRAGLSVATLTNGTAAITRAFLQRAGLADLVGATLEARSSGVWKPHREAYRWAAAQLGREPGALLLVAVHPWDVHGAVSAGLGGAWLDRDGASYPQYFRAPQIQGATMDRIIAAAPDARLS